LTNPLSGITSITALEFLVLMLYWQAVCGGMELTGICEISTKDLSKIRAIWQFIALGELLAFGSNGQTVCVIGQGDDLQLFAGAIAPPLLYISVELERV
jgi:hypothetical protein